MALIAKRPRKVRGAEAMACCGEICDARCRESSVRETQFRRRVSTSGGVRVS